ncbi:hypothetical protein SAMN05443575_1137 [Jatrophihabitans endophyticus]|uniref:Uncharacterized protein n=1 Tax=Jatrophihabitans endophyticus TaxID=1206085 RepID=A0A1M5GDC0_9ACTN|nr:hypothetical protein [Jatrophihabitans endophyticus]SHG01704.1 hypothetical protein SAMN05443575_1137 [Jatrophihabitans endophyticus]
MTYQSPPPPPGGTPPPPPAGRPAGFDPKSVNPLDWGIIGAGVLAFIFSFISFFTYSSKAGLGESLSESAWSGFVSLLAILLIIAGTAATALVLFAPQVSLPVPGRLIALGAFALAVVLLVIQLFYVPNYAGVGGAGYDAAVDEGHGFGYWATLVLAIAGTALALMRFQATGGQLPANLQGRVPNIGGYGPQGGIAGGTATPPQGGAATPPPGGVTPPPSGYGPPAGGGTPPPPAGGTPPPPAGGTPPPPPPGYGPPR